MQGYHCLGMDPKLKAAYERIFARELVARERIFLEYPSFVVSAIPDRAGNAIPTAIIRRWRREQRVFAFRHRDHYFFPSFQFTEGVPKPIIGQLLRLVRPAHGWYAMYWFVAANGWLEAGAPVDYLDTDQAAVIEAACHANDEISD
jgi:hypothetical protein